MTRGRIAKPTSMHELAGNPSKINLNERKQTEPQYPALEDMTPPDWMDEESQGYWIELAERFSAIRVLTTMDTMALELLISAYAEYRDCLRYIEANGRSYETLNTAGEVKYTSYPEVGQMQSAREYILKMLQQFGWTPASRSKVKALGAQGADPVLAFINQGRGK